MSDDGGGFAAQLAPYAGMVFEPQPGEPPFKAGRPSRHATGVSFTAPWEDPYAGFPTHARRSALALASSGVPVHLRSLNPNAQWTMGPGRLEARKTVEHLLDPQIQQYAVLVRMVVPTPEGLYNLTSHPHLEPAQVRALNRCRIVYTVWERQTIEPLYVDALRQFGQCWVANHDNRRMLVEAGLDADRVRVVPCPFLPDDPLLGLEGRKRMPGPVRFYHIGKWEPRKQHHTIIGAFLRVFAPGQAIFMLKTSSRAPDAKLLAPYPPGPGESITHWLQQPEVKAKGWTADNVDQGVLVRREAMTAQQIVQMHAAGDVYVTASQGEGFDMPAFDSKLAGNLMVYVPSGGPQDYAGSDDLRVDPDGRVACHPFYGWRGCEYLRYRAADLERALALAAERVASGVRTRGVDLGPFALQDVGRRMREYVEEVAGDVDWDA